MIQSNRPMRIACMTYQGLSAQGIKSALHYMFPEAEIVSVFPQHMRAHVLKNYDILILPGITNEDSLYPTLLPPHKMDVLKDSIENDGLILWTFCAASYYMFEEISYQRRNGIFKTRKGAGFIKGSACHGFNHITRRELNACPWNDYVLAGIHVDGHHELLRALNCNGPTLIFDEKEEPLAKAFMRYQDIKGAAGVIKKMGNGLLLALGVHPELSPIHHKLPADFMDFEMDRWTILSLIKEKIMQHRQPQNLAGQPAQLKMAHYG